jgi:hypothetical protein
MTEWGNQSKILYCCCSSLFNKHTHTHARQTSERHVRIDRSSLSSTINNEWLLSTMYTTIIIPRSLRFDCLERTTVSNSTFFSRFQATMMKLQCHSLITLMNNDDVNFANHDFFPSLLRSSAGKQCIALNQRHSSQFNARPYLSQSHCMDDKWTPQSCTHISMPPVAVWSVWRLIRVRSARCSKKYMTGSSSNDMLADMNMRDKEQRSGFSHKNHVLWERDMLRYTYGCTRSTDLRVRWAVQWRQRRRLYPYYMTGLFSEMTRQSSIDSL